ncbi:MAG: shikimate dehydrogenase [Bacteroidales bacterium]|nr:shikimate dehydrogenase [Bacteroidales bacterium]
MTTYGLIGYPIGHSFSEKFFSEKFARENIDAKYLMLEMPSIDELMGTLDNLPEQKGFNVTIPYKQQVMPLLDEIDPEAAEVGAVNVVRVGKDANGKRTLKGYNSDIYGFWESIKPFIKKDIHKKALILGTGGASKAVLYMLRKNGIETLFVSRSQKEGMITYEDITPEIMNEYKVIVNCSPVGMHPHVDECPAIPYECMTTDHLAFDLVYNPDVTLFLKKSAEQGAATKNGLEMLHLQAIRAWEIWNME